MDTTRADRCGFNGYKGGTTPFLEKFAEDAVVFRDAWTPSPWTPPAHASLFTGLVPEHHGLMADNSLSLSPGSETLAERLRDAGYATAAFTNNPFVGDASGLLQGFETKEFLFRRTNRPYPTAAVTHDLATTWIERQRSLGRPYFAFLNQMEPHLPYTPPADMQERFVSAQASAADVERGRWFRYPEPVGVNFGIKDLHEPLARILSSLYDAEVATLDRELGRFLGGLRASGALDDTVVVITADHGENLGDHGLVDHMFSVHRTLLHVPLIVRLPGVFDGGRVVDDVVRLEDVTPTLLSVCGLAPLTKADGKSLLGDTSGRTARGILGRPKTLFASARRAFPGVRTAPFDHRLRSVYDGRFHLVERSNGRVELYDVDEDPGETTDLSRTEPGHVQRLRAAGGDGSWKSR